MSVFLVLLLTVWITGSIAALLHLHVGNLLLDQWQPGTQARKFQTPVKVEMERGEGEEAEEPLLCAAAAI